MTVFDLAQLNQYLMLAGVNLWNILNIKQNGMAETWSK